MQAELDAADLQLLRLLAAGKPVKAIASEIKWSLGKTKARLASIYHVLNVRTGTAAVAWYVKNETRAACFLDDRAMQYRSELVAGHFEYATQRWENTSVGQRPELARIHVCLMYLLCGQDTAALKEANGLSVNETGLVFLLQKCLSGEQSALPMLRNLLDSMPSGTRAKDAGLMALFFCARKHKLNEIALAAAYAMIVEAESRTCQPIG